MKGRHDIETLFPQRLQLTEFIGLTNNFCQEDMQFW